jgi:hypothetical protein
VAEKMNTDTVSEKSSVTWAADTWRMPAWLWTGVAAMAVALLHILLDMGVGLFDMDGRLSAGVGSVLIVIVLSHIWWALSFIAGTQGRGSGILSAAVLALGWTTMMNGYPIVFCPPTCMPGSPLSDIAHIGRLVLGPLATLAALWALLRDRPKMSWCCQPVLHCWSLRCSRRSAARRLTRGVPGAAYAHDSPRNCPPKPR